MNSKKLVVAMYNQGQNEAGPKAKCDIEKFLTTAGFQQVNFHFQGNRKAKLMSFKQSWWDIPRTFAQITADQVFFSIQLLIGVQTGQFCEQPKKLQLKFF